MFRIRISSRFTIAYLATVVLLIAGPQVAWAQLEEIIVTTRKREESLQKVPIAVKAIGAEQIELQGINSLEKALMLDPSVNFQTGFNSADTKVMIRGVSPTRGRANVAFLVDGIDITSENMIAAGAGLLANRRLLNDVERIEIVKGSQSALFGRAAFAGAIAYTTKEPGDAFESNVRFDANEYGFLDLSGAIGGPIPGLEDVLGLRFNGVYWTDDGFYENSISGEGVGGGEGYGAALVGVWTPGDSWKIKGRVEHSDDQYDPPPMVRQPQDTPVVYPESTLIPDIIGGFSNATASMLDHGLYCAEILPDDLKEYDERQLALKDIFPDYPTMPADPNAPIEEKWRLALSDGSDPMRPGFCLASQYGTADGKSFPGQAAVGDVVTQSEDPATGVDYKGTTLETTRATLLIEFDREWGTFSSNSGYTNAEGEVRGDQDHRAVGRPDTLLQAQGSNTDKNTEQFSQELRFSSAWDNSPVQVTLGGLYWHEERSTVDHNFINDCFLTGKSGNGDLALNIPGLCDGGTFGGLETGPGATVESWQD